MGRKFPGLETEDGTTLLFSTFDGVDVETDGRNFWFFGDGGRALRLDYEDVLRLSKTVIAEYLS